MKTKRNLLMFSIILIILMMGLLSNPLVYSSTFNAPFLIEIDSVAVNDPYARFHALTFDNPIPTVFWWEGDWYYENEEAMIGTRSKSMHYERMFFLSSGEHVLEYAVSAYVGYWRATVKINGVVVASENLTTYKHLIMNFDVESLPPTLDLVPDFGIAATTLVGSGFAPNSQISVTWDNISIPTVPTPLSSDSYGNFTTVISVLNQTTSGNQTVKAVDEMGNEADAIFTVYSIDSMLPQEPSIDKTGAETNAGLTGYTTPSSKASREELSEQQNQPQELPELLKWIILPLLIVAILVTVFARNKLVKKRLE
jgi:hypothetical protein